VHHDTMNLISTSLNSGKPNILQSLKMFFDVIFPYN